MAYGYHNGYPVETVTTPNQFVPEMEVPQRAWFHGNMTQQHMHQQHQHMHHHQQHHMHHHQQQHLPQQQHLHQQHQQQMHHHLQHQQQMHQQQHMHHHQQHQQHMHQYQQHVHQQQQQQVQNYNVNTQDPEIQFHVTQQHFDVDQQQQVPVPVNQLTPPDDEQRFGVYEALIALENPAVFNALIPNAQNRSVDNTNRFQPNWRNNTTMVNGYQRGQPQQNVFQSQSTVVQLEAPAVVSNSSKAPFHLPRGRKKAVNGQKAKFARCECPNCRSGFNKRPGMKKIHICHMPDCKKEYCTTSHLRAHILTHEGIRPFACTFHGCTKCFYRSDELARHMRIHTGDRNYKCKVCFKEFIRSDHLSKHSKGHTDEKMPRKPRAKAPPKPPIVPVIQQEQQQQPVFNMTYQMDGTWATNF